MLIKEKKAMIKPNVFIDASWKEQGIEFHWWTDSTPLHSHNDIVEFFIIINGSCNHFYKNVTAKLHMNDVVLVLPNEKHLIDVDPNEVCVHMNFSLTLDLFHSICSIINKNAYRQLLEFEQPLSMNLSETIIDYVLLQIQYSYNFANQPLDLCNSIYKSVATTIISNLFTHLQVKNIDEYPKWLSDIIFKLQNYEFLLLPLSEIYSMSNYSPSVFLSYFKFYMGETLISYISRLKLKYACEFLSQTNKSVLEISGLLGYDSLSYFSGLFKKAIGETPSQYRKHSLSSISGAL